MSPRPKARTAERCSIGAAILQTLREDERTERLDTTARFVTGRTRFITSQINRVPARKDRLSKTCRLMIFFPNSPPDQLRKNSKLRMTATVLP